jgi:hypothetical protein
MTERHLKRMRQRAAAANAFACCDMPPGMVCHNDTRGHWHWGPTWLMEKAESRAAEGLPEPEGTDA